MSSSVAPPCHTRQAHGFDPLRDLYIRNASRSSSKVPESVFKITPYGRKSSYPYGHYQRPVNSEGPLDDMKQKIRASKDHSKVFAEEDDYSSDSDSDGELDESPKRHKVKKLGVL